MTFSLLTIAVLALTAGTTIVPEKATETETETEGTNVIEVVVVVVAGNGAETTIGIGIGTGTEIRTPSEPVAVAVVVVEVEVEVVLTEETEETETEMETEMGSDFASAGRPAELKLIRRRAGPIRTCITSAGVALAGGRRTVVEVGIVSMSLGRAQAETMTGAREVRDTKEGMHDDDDVVVVVSIFAVVVHLISTFETNRTTGYYTEHAHSTKTQFAARLHCWR